ncbi:MAG: DUF1232 domain-containing protein [Saprospiraceae bacterium]|nr:DUF1232 domain-containing protein [Saprospiraceae bacterium]
MKTPAQIFKRLLKKFDHQKFLEKLQSMVHQAGTQVIYAVLLLYYAYKRPDTPSWAKRMVLGTLAYLLAPIDAIPDLSPFFGFTDDLGVLTFGLVSIAGHINDQVKEDARAHIQRLFSKVDPEDLKNVERKIQ